MSVKGFNFDGTVQKYDYDSLDNKIEKTTLAPEFTPGKAYSTGDMAFYEGKLYSRKTDGTDQSWILSNWTETDIEERLTAVEGDLSDLKGDLEDLAGLETTWSDGFWNVNTQTFNSDSTYKHSGYIPVNEVTVPIHFTIKAIYTVASYILFDENKNYLKKNNTESTSLIEIDDVITDFEGASFIVFQTYSGYGYKAKLRYCNITNLKVNGLGDLKDELSDILETNIIFHANSKTVSGTGQYIHEDIYTINNPVVGTTYTFEFDNVDGTTDTYVGYIYSFDQEDTRSNHPLTLNLKKVSYTVAATDVRIIFTLYPFVNGPGSATYSGVKIYTGTSPYKRVASEYITIETDKELKIPDKPADGAETGKQISNLAGSIRQIETDVVVLESGTYADVDGTHKSTNTTRIRNSYPLPINGVQSITIPDGYQVWFFRLDIDLNLISTYGQWISGKINISNVVTDLTEYLTFAIKNTSTPSSDISSQVQLVQDGLLVERLSDIIRQEVRNIPQENLSFANRVISENLFDYTSEDMCKPGWWYYNTTIGSIVEAKQTSSTTHYVAIKVPVYDSTKITLGIYPNDLSRLVYWVGAVDSDMRLIEYQIINTNAPITYNVPEGAVYFLASYNLGSGNFSRYLPRVMAVNGDTITEYEKYYSPYYLLENCRVDDDTHERVDAIQSIVGAQENSVRLHLPDAYDLVAGDTFELFFKGIVNAVNPELYFVEVDCAEGSVYSKRFIITPNTAKDLNMTVTLYGINHNVLDSKTVTLHIHNKATSPSTTKNILCVGDSLTTAGAWPREFHRRLTASDGTPEGDGLSNINFIGTRELSGVHYEGYGGWTLNSYNTENVSFNTRVITCTHDKTEAQDQHSVYKDTNNIQWKLETIETGQIKIIAITGEGRDFPDTGTLTWVSGGVNHSNIVYTAQSRAAGNPFWNSTTQMVDFSNYANGLGVSGIDYVYVLIGWNSASWTEADYKASVQTFINNVHTSFPNAKIIFVGLEIPARDGLGANYGATGIYSKYYQLMQFVFNLDTWYKEVAENNTNVYHVNLSGQFDTEHNMLTDTRPVNVRNQELETYQSNGVHPSYNGSMQIADAVYRDLVSRL